jgi:hypothetical protein
MVTSKMSIILRASRLAIIAVGALTVLAYLSALLVDVLAPRLFNVLGTFFIVLLYPGGMVALLIGGGHGGRTVTEAWLALVASIVVNTILYSLLFASILWIRRRAAEKRGGAKEEGRG